MTTPDELQRAIERLSNGMGKYGFANVYNDDVQLLLSEHTKLLATVKRLRGALRMTLLEAKINIESTTPNEREKI